MITNSVLLQTLREMHTLLSPEANGLHPKVPRSIFSGESARLATRSDQGAALLPVQFYSRSCSISAGRLNGRTWARPQEPHFSALASEAAAWLLAPNAVPTARGKGTRASGVGAPILRCSRVSMQVTLGGDGRDTLQPLTRERTSGETGIHQPRSVPSQAGRVAPPVASARAGTLTA